MGQPAQRKLPGFSGTVAQGSVSVGDTIRVTARGQTARVKEIVTMGQSLQVAVAGEAVTLTMDHELDIPPRGLVLLLLTARSNSPTSSKRISSSVQRWRRNARAQLRHQACDPVGHSLADRHPRQDRHCNVVAGSRHIYEPNDIARCTLAVSKPLVCDSYANSRTLGSFILVDRFTHATVAAGMIRHSLRRADNVHRQALAIARPTGNGPDRDTRDGWSGSRAFQDRAKSNTGQRPRGPPPSHGSADLYS